MTVVGGASWRRVAAAGFHTCARKQNGRLSCWGDDDEGAVGDGDDDEVDEPAPVEVFGGLTDWSKPGTGTFHSCATRAGGRLFCWGEDADGQLGDGDDNEAPELAPVEVFGAATNWKRFDAGRRHTCAVKTSGRLFCWGRDASGQIGDIDDDEADEPELVEVAAHP